MSQTIERYYKKEFWSQENLKYAKTHFRLEKIARIINRMSRGRELELLDVGCGPGLLMHFLNDNIHYHGIDMAIHNPAPNLLECDFLEAPISFRNRRFDVVLAQGVFEYIGSHQGQKFLEIAELLNENGVFIASYVNFDHHRKVIYEPYNNVQSFDDFKKNLSHCFHIDHVIPTSHRWHHKEPTSVWLKAVHKYVNAKIPLVSSRFAVQYIFVCSVRKIHAN